MIEWFGSSKELEISNEEIELIEKWVRENGPELHNIHHFLRDHKMEGSKIVFGEQFESDEGDIIIKSLEVYIIYDIVFVIKSEERQMLDANATVKRFTKLGIVNLCSLNDKCCR